MDRLPPRRLRIVVAVLSSLTRRGRVRVEGSLLVVNVLAKVSVDLRHAEFAPGARVRVINLGGVADVQLPTDADVVTTRISLGRTRVSHGVFPLNA